MADRREASIPDGQAPPPGNAAAALGRALDERARYGPAWSIVDTVLTRLRRWHLDLDAAGGFRPETSANHLVFEWLPASEVASLHGVSQQSVTRRCRLRGLEGTHLVDGHGWFVHRDVVDQLMEDAHDGERRDNAA